jgi:tetratricopeptide (TPR) repeat protein
MASADQARWYAIVDLELGNLRAALAWAAEHGAYELGLEIATCLLHYWEQRGLLSEGRNWLESFLAAAQATQHASSARGVDAISEPTVDALIAAGVLADRQDDYVRARQLFELAQTRARGLHDARRLARALSWIGNVEQAQGAYERAAAAHEEACTAARSVGEPNLLSLVLNNYALTLRDRGDLDAALEAFTEALALARASGVMLRAALIASNLGVLHRRRGDLGAAQRLLEESARVRRELGDRWGTVVTLVQLGDVALERGELDRAEASYLESVRLNGDIGVRELFAMGVEGMARAAIARRRFEVGVRYAAAAARARETIGVPNPPAEQALLERDLDQARNALGDVAFRDHWTAGQSTPLDSIVSELVVTV